MAGRQYRLSGEFGDRSSAGSAIFVLANKLGSGKRLVLKSCEITTVLGNTQGITSTGAYREGQLHVVHGDVVGGEELTPVKFDTNAADVPDGIHLLRGGACTYSASDVYRATWNPAPTTQASWLGRPHSMGSLAGFGINRSTDTSLERVTVNEGESASVIFKALYAAGGNTTALPVEISAIVTVHGSPARSYAVRFRIGASGPNHALFSVVNDTGSGEVVSLSDVVASAIGDTTTPYFQLVPVGGTIDMEATSKPQVLPLDSAAASISSVIDTGLNVVLLPYGQPENALADSSGGSPKGFNYLKTKDFLGPSYRNMFYELGNPHNNTTPTLPDTGFCAWNQKWSDIFVRNSGITLWPGEGIALVAAAETATGSTIGHSGWGAYHYNLVFSVEPEAIPTITIAGMVEGSRWRIERVSDNSVVATGVADGTGTTSFVYSTEDTPLSLRLRVRKASAPAIYKPFEITYTQTVADATLPVSQVPD